MSAPQTDESRHLKIQRLFLKEMPSLSGWFTAMASDPGLAEDLVQETFLTVMQKQDSFELGTNFRAWVFAIARFKLLAASRRPANREHCFEAETMELLMAECPEVESYDDRLELLPRCLRKLAPRARQAIELRYASALRPPEIAATMKWTVNAVNVALSRARKLLRECIETEIAKRSGSPAPNA